MTKKVSLNVKCPKCNHSLMDYKNTLNDKPSIKVDVKCQGDFGHLWLCSTYGCYDKQSNVELVEGCKVEMFCPHCKELLNTDVDCKIDGDGKMIKFNIEIGGIVSICSRVGCTNHYVMFDDLEDVLRKFHDEYGV